MPNLTYQSQQHPVINYSTRSAEAKQKALIAKLLQQKIYEDNQNGGQVIGGRLMPSSALATALNTFSGGLADSQAMDAEKEKGALDDQRRNYLANALQGGSELSPEILAQSGADPEELIKLALTKQARIPMASPNYIPKEFKPIKEGNFEGFMDPAGNRIRNAFAMTEAQQSFYNPEVRRSLSEAGQLGTEGGKAHLIEGEEGKQLITGGEMNPRLAPQKPINTMSDMDATRQVESGGDINAVSPKGALGPYQIMPETAAKPGYGMEPLPDNATPEQQRLFAAEYKLNIARANPTWTYDQINSAYNMGPGNVAKGRRNTDYENKIRSVGISPTRANELKTEQAIQEAEGKAKVTNQQITEQANIKKANAGKAMLSLANSTYDGEKIEDIIDRATGSGIGAARDVTAKVFGGATKGAMAQEKLKTIQGWLTSNVPRMEGPQSDADRLQYQQMASSISDPTVPAEIKKASFRAMKEIAKKYALINGDQQDAANPASSGWSIEEVK